MVWIPPVVNEVVIEAIPSAFVTAEKVTTLLFGLVI